jgi:hypothetical protein
MKILTGILYPKHRFGAITHNTCVSAIMLRISNY